VSSFRESCLRGTLLAGIAIAAAVAAAGGHGAGAAAASSLVPGLVAVLPAAAPQRLSLDSEPYRVARGLLPDRFLVSETKRFVVISDAPLGWARRQADLLDKTHAQFQRFTRRLGIEPEPLRHKLVCVLFQEYDDYRAFARANDGVTADWISGYYSPQHDRIVFYNIETNPDFARASGGGGAPPGQLLAGARRLTDDYLKAATATVVHEAVHQLAFHTGVQSPHIENPLWLSEGLATAFETDDAEHAFGPDRGYGAREEQFRKILREGGLIPLKDLVTWARMPDSDDKTIAAVYHESYALVSWLSRHRRGHLRVFMESLRAEPSGRPTPQRHLQLFEKAFGDVNKLEQTWLRYERSR
jgi:hypothetical protein